VELFAEGLAGQFRTEGASVTIGRSELGGEPCAHLAIDKPAEAQDMFIQDRGRFVYSVLVTAKVRDPDLIARARAGLRFDTAPASAP
jgi:hypothetical protein